MTKYDEEELKAKIPPAHFTYAKRSRKTPEKTRRIFYLFVQTVLV